MKTQLNRRRFLRRTETRIARLAFDSIGLLFTGLVLACATHLAAQDSPYADGFPPPVPSPKAPSIELE